MRVLIADDEQHVREGVELSINWPDYNITGIFMAEDGIEALDIVRRERPELIICDMSMPRMDGPSFLEKLREENNEAKVIVLSGYQEFRYTRATLLAKGVDYLLKPFKIDDLNKAIAKAVREINENKESMTEELEKKHQVQEANVMLNEQRMLTYLQGEHISHEGVRQLLDSSGFPFKEFYVTLFLPRNLATVVERNFMGDEALLFFSVRNILRDVFRPLGPVYFFRMDFFFCVMTGGKTAPADVAFYNAKLKDSWVNTIKLKTISGVVAKKYNYMELLTGIKDTKSEILGFDILGGRLVGTGLRKSPSFIDKEMLVLEALKKQDKEYLAALIQSFVQGIRAQGSLSIKELQHCTIEVNLLIIRISRQLNWDHHTETLSLWISDLDEWQKELTHIFWLMIESEGDNLSSLGGIQAIRYYIETHIGEDINLTFLSDQFHFSPQYISKKFKETYNTTVMNYLTDLRIEKAKSLLCHSNKTILEVSQTVGYEDDNYFGKVFRKHVGESPSQFRRACKSADSSVEG